MWLAVYTTIDEMYACRTVCYSTIIRIRKIFLSLTHPNNSLVQCQKAYTQTGWYCVCSSQKIVQGQTSQD